MSVQTMINSLESSKLYWWSACKQAERRNKKLADKNDSLAFECYELEQQVAALQAELDAAKGSE